MKNLNSAKHPKQTINANLPHWLIVYNRFVTLIARLHFVWNQATALELKVIAKLFITISFFFGLLWVYFLYRIIVSFQFHETIHNSANNNEVGRTKSTEMSPAVGQFIERFASFYDRINVQHESFRFCISNYSKCYNSIDELVFFLLFLKLLLKHHWEWNARSNKNDQIDVNVF